MCARGDVKCNDSFGIAIFLWYLEMFFCENEN